MVPVPSKTPARRVHSLMVWCAAYMCLRLEVEMRTAVASVLELELPLPLGF